MNDHRYDDLLNQSRPVSSIHKPMPMAQRAGQFSPFSALEGYSGVIENQQIIYQEKTLLDGEQMEAINAVLLTLKRGQRLRCSYYDTGRIIDLESSFVRLDPIHRHLETSDGRIRFDDLLDLQIPEENREDW